MLSLQDGFSQAWISGIRWGELDIADRDLVMEIEEVFYPYIGTHLSKQYTMDAELVHDLVGDLALKLAETDLDRVECRLFSSNSTIFFYNAWDVVCLVFFSRKLDRCRRKTDRWEESGKN